MSSPASPDPIQHQLDGANQPCRRPSATLVSVIVPMLNEVENVDAVIAAILGEAGQDLEFDVLIADGGSTDGTIERVRKWEAVANVRLIEGDAQRGLAGDVLTAAALARTDVVVVMDADLSHPPDRIRALVKPVLAGSSDMVVGSRYVPGGATPGWPRRRLLLSRLGAVLAWPLTEVADPMSGFFAVRRDRLLAVDPDAAGFKIGLEIIAHGGGALRASEIPIAFHDRVHGHSKIGKAQMIAYLRRLLVLAGGAVSAGGAARFAAVGLIGMFVDLFTFETLFALGAPLVSAHVTSFCIATASNYFLNSRWAFAAGSSLSQKRGRDLYLRYVTVCLLALAFRGGVLAGASGSFGLPPQIAILYAIGAAAIVSYLGSAFFVFPSVNPRVAVDIRWRVAAIGVASYVIAMRLMFLGLADLLPQEAYYWNYAQHLDIGYLDHPPMVAWLIWVGTSLFGNTEFGVRFPAWLCWFATAVFSFRLAQELFGKSAAFVSLLLVAVLPFYFATGFLMTPDAPLAAAWAGALYFLERALVGEKQNAWWGVGICIGLGLLSKYTIALLAPSALIFMLADMRARLSLARPEPYIAAALALFIFFPVIYWNLENGLASFAFQSTRRVDAAFRFSLPELLSNAAILLTPTGLVAAVAALWVRRRTARRSIDADDQRVSNFMLIFTLVPLAIFIAFSLTRGVKLNWTGPLWLAVLPAVSATILAGAEHCSAMEHAMRRAWAPTLAVCLVAYGLALNYLVLGVPGFGYAVSLPNAPVAWSEFGREAASLELQVKESTDDEPMMIGLDNYNIASVLAFYGDRNGEGASSSVGRGILGHDSLMYDYWFRPEELRGKPAVLFAFKRNQIFDPSLASHFARLSDPIELSVSKNGKPAGRFFYRIGYEFKGAGSGSPPAGLESLLERKLVKHKKSRPDRPRCRHVCGRSRWLFGRAGRTKTRRSTRGFRKADSISASQPAPPACLAASSRRPTTSARQANHSLRYGAGLTLLLVLVGCAAQQLDPARVGREQPGRSIKLDAGFEENGTCASIGSAIIKHFQKMETLKKQEVVERGKPPATVELAYERWFGPPGAGYAATEELRQESAKVDRLDAALAAKGCSTIKNDMPRSP